MHYVRPSCLPGSLAASPQRSASELLAVTWPALQISNLQKPHRLIAPPVRARKQLPDAMAEKKSAAPSHPPYSALIKEAILSLKERNGSSLQAITKHVGEKHPNLPGPWKKVLSNHVRKLRLSGKLVQVKASYKLSEDFKKGPAKPKKAKKPAAAKPKKVTKPKAAKAKTPKKATAAKKPKAAKKPAAPKAEAAAKPAAPAEAKPAAPAPAKKAAAPKKAMKPKTAAKPKKAAAKPKTVKKTSAPKPKKTTAPKKAAAPKAKKTIAKKAAPKKAAPAAKA